jgi:hypothetical protein
MKRLGKRNKMKTLNLNNKKVSKGALTEIKNFVYENRLAIGDEQKLFYSDVQRIMEQELRKPAARRMTMTSITERAHNIEYYILAAGATSVTTEFINNGKI